MHQLLMHKLELPEAKVLHPSHVKCSGADN